MIATTAMNPARLPLPSERGAARSQNRASLFLQLFCTARYEHRRKVVAAQQTVGKDMKADSIPALQ
jgi:hypothetical protein